MNGFFAFKDGAAVDVHVVFHAVEHGCVGGELDRWRGFAAEDAAAAGGETHEVGATGHLAGGGDRVVAGGVHEDEAAGRHRLGVADDVDQVGGAGFGHGAERLLQDGGEAAGFVAGRRVGVHFGAFLGGVVLPPAHQGDELLAHFGGDGAAGEEVFGAVGFGSFAQDHGAAVADQEVARRAERRVRGDAGIAVAAAALEGDGEFAQGSGFALDGVGFVQHLADEGDAGLDRLADAAHLLDVHRADAVGEFLLFQQAAELVHFAAQADDDDVGEVHMSRVTGQRAAQQAQRFAVGHAAAGLVGQRDDAVHIRPGGQRVGAGDRVAAELLGNQFGGVGAAVHRGQQADVVAGGDPAVGAADALKRDFGVGARGGASVLAIGVVLGEITHAEVLGVDVLAGRDGGGGEADDLAVAADGGAGGEGPQGDFVSGGDPRSRTHAVGDRGRRHEGGAGDDDVVVGVEFQEGDHGTFSLLHSPSP